MWGDTRDPENAIALPHVLIKSGRMSMVDIVMAVQGRPDEDPVDILWEVFTEPYLTDYNHKSGTFGTEGT